MSSGTTRPRSAKACTRTTLGSALWKEERKVGVGRMRGHDHGHNRIPSRALHTVYVPPVQIRGRVGGIRIQTNEVDFVAFCIYLAPM
eukprot:1908643-Pyramimonas_sp.AAC.1